MNVASVMAHQDDELVCLGTMLKMLERGDRLHFICVTDGSGGMAHAPEMTRQEAAAIRHSEMRALADALSATYVCLGEHDEFLYDTPDVRLRLLEAMRAAEADVVFTHHNRDYNLDHVTVNQLVQQCAIHMPLPMIKTDSAPTRHTPAVFVVEPMGAFEFEPTHWVDISNQIERKLKLAMCHRSQDKAFRAAFGPEKGLDQWILSMSQARGQQAGVAHAEAFRPMLVRGLVKPYQVLP